MQLAKCLVSLSGNRNNQVLRTNVSAAEILVLRHVHGEASVSEVVVTGTVERTNIEEKALLCEKYNRPGKDKVEKLFPGIDPRMPMTLKDASIDFILAPKTKHTQGNVVPMKGGRKDEVTDAEKASIAASESVVTKVNETPDAPKSATREPADTPSEPEPEPADATA